MEYIRERVAYLKGLAEGMDLKDNTNEGKLLLAIIDVLEDVSLAIEDISEVQDEHEEMIDDLDVDLGKIEEYIYGDLDEDDDFDMLEDEDFDDDEEDDDEEDHHHHPVLVECPYCYGVFTSEKKLFDEEAKNIECPHCHKKIEVEWVSEDHECGCEHCDCEDEDEE